MVLQDKIVPYSSDNTFKALKKAILKLGEFKVDRFDDNTKTIYLEAEMTWCSWGEKIIISLEQRQTDSTTISVLSKSKTGVILGGVLGLLKNKKNIKIVMGALADELKDYISES